MTMNVAELAAAISEVTMLREAAPSSLADAFRALAPVADKLCRAAPLPEGTAGQMLAVVGAEAGLLVTVADGRATVEPWSGGLGEPPGVDTTLRFDSVETLLAALGGTAAVPGLLMRRRLRLEGSIQWLEEVRGALGPAASHQRDAAVEREMVRLRALVSDVLRGAGAGAAAARREPQAAWMPDEASSSCLKCLRPFTLLRRRHHCRSCGELCCASCAPRRAVAGQCYLACTRSPSTQGVVGRVCGPCFRQRDLSREPAATCLAFRESPEDSLASRTTMASRSRGGAVAEETPVQSVRSGGGDLGELDVLRDELKALRQRQAEAAEVRLQGEVAGFWTTTVLAIAITGAVLGCLSARAMFVWVTCLATLHLFPRLSVRRIIHVAWASTVVGLTLLLTRRRLRWSRLESNMKEATWLTVHSTLARFITQRIMALGGFWTKLGQQLSVNPALPAPYLEELKKLQDGMPEAPIGDVLATLREEFGAAAAGIAVPEGLPALGVASIAQVHRATWTPPGATASRDIVIKVQHRDAGRTFRQDMWSSAILARVAHWIDPDSVPDVRPLIAKMRDVTTNELDFRLEAENLSHAGKVVRDAGADVVVPSVVPGLVARRAMAMEFIDGVPLSKLKEELPSVDPARLVAALVDHYGVQFVVDGRFNADPHPGNLMVERATGKLVVLDWGMCITLPRNHVQAYASILFSVATYDVWGLVKGLEAVEMDFRDGEVFEPLAFLRTMRFILRDSKPMDMARDEMSRAISTVETIHKNGPRRYKRSPLAAFQGDFVYFGKALALLYSVSSTLDVRHPILQTLVLRALSTMLGRASAEPMPRQPSAFLPALPAALPEARGPLERELQQHLCGLYVQGRLLGAQLCVLQGGRSGQPCSLLADVAIGVHGWTHHAPITASTRFNLTDISKLVVAVAVLRLVDSGRLKLSDRLAERWEAFRDGGDEPQRAAITVEQVLGHTAGCWCPLPPSITELHELLDPEAMLEAVARTPCAEAPGTAQRYHHTAFGYLLRGACRHLAGRELADLWTELARDVSAQAGGLARERDLLLRLSPEEAESVAMPANAITSASLDEVSTMISQVYMLMGGSDPSPSAAAKAAQGIWGREHLIDPSLYGRSAGGVAASCLPGLQGFGNARAVASLLQAVSSGGLLSKRLLKESLWSRKPPAPGGDGRPPEDPAAELASELGHVLRLGCFQDFGLGVQLVGPKVWAGADAAVGGLPPAWGHLAQGGSAAVVLPGPQPVAVALLVNMAEGGVGAHAATSSVLQVVARRCGLTQLTQ